MLRDGSFESVNAWGDEGGHGGEAVAAKRPRVQCADDARCEQIHQRLRRIAKARGALDLQEAEALRDAEAACVWRRYGYASLLEYLEVELGYTPRVAIERIRVAKAIVELPMIGEAMLQGELSFSAARELTRVATRDTEGEWLDAARELNVRQLEERVAGHKRGDRPTDQPDPSLRMKDLRISVRPETYALMRQAQQILGRERGERLDDDAYQAAAARTIVDGHRSAEHVVAGVSDAGELQSPDDVEGASAEPGAPGGGCRKVAPYQVGSLICSGCKRGWQHGGGVTVEMSPASVAMAMCDAQEIGPVDAAKPERTRQAISPSVRQLVSQRDQGRCRVTGCRSSWNLDVHHLVHRENGGTNDPNNLILMCEGHHRAHHEGSLAISGSMPDLVFTRRASSSFSTVSRVVDTTAALAKAGYTRREAKEAAEQTRTHVGTADWPIEAWIKYALSKCPRGSS